MAAREGAVNAKRAGLCQLRDLLVTTPEPLRAELRPLTQARLLARLTADGAAEQAGPRAAWGAARAPLRRSPRPAADRRGARARPRDQDPDREARTPAPRPARRRAAPRGPGRALLVTQRPDQKRGSVRPPRRRRPDPRLLRTNDPLPPRPQRRPTTQPSPAPDPRHPTSNPSAHDRLHRTAHQRRQDPPRSQPLPQALPRPQPLPTPRERNPTGRLTNIEASLAHATDSGLATTSVARDMAGTGIVMESLTTRFARTQRE